MKGLKRVIAVLLVAVFAVGLFPLYAAAEGEPAIAVRTEMVPYGETDDIYSLDFYLTCTPAADKTYKLTQFTTYFSFDLTNIQPYDIFENKVWTPIVTSGEDAVMPFSINVTGAKWIDDTANNRAAVKVDLIELSGTDITNNPVMSFYFKCDDSSKLDATSIQFEKVYEDGSYMYSLVNDPDAAGSVIIGVQEVNARGNLVTGTAEIYKYNGASVQETENTLADTDVTLAYTNSTKLAKPTIALASDGVNGGLTLTITDPNDPAYVDSYDVILTGGSLSAPSR